jgi:sulfur transfer protein SufE
VDELAALDKLTRTLLLLEYGDEVADYPEALKLDARLVPGCASRVWLDAACEGGAMRYRAAADGQIAQGMVAMLVNGLSGEAPATVLAVAARRSSATPGSPRRSRPRARAGSPAMLRRMQQEAERFA